MNRAFSYIYLFLNIFQFHYGSIELALAFNLLAILAIYLKEKKLVVSKMELSLIGFTVLIFLYSFLTILISPNADIPYLISRNLRIILSTLTIAITYKYFFRSQHDFLITLSHVLLTHIITIYIQLSIPATKPIFADIVSYTKPLFSKRNFGLVNGYESTALLSILAAAIYTAKSFKDKSYKSLLLLFFSMATSVFISRTAILLVIISFLFIFFRYNRYFRTRNMLALSPFILLAIIMIINLLLPIIFGSIPEIRDMFPGIASKYPITNPEVTGYSKQSLTYLTSKMVIFPRGMGLLFGEGRIPKSDIGYIKLLFYYGIIGTAVLILTFGKLLKDTYLNICQTASATQFQAKLFMEVLILLIVILNFKGLFLYTRGTHELLIILIFTFKKFTTQERTS